MAVTALAQVTGCAARQQMSLELRITRAGEHDHRQFGVGLAKRLQAEQAIQVRHHEVHQHQIKVRVQLSQFERAGAGGCLKHLDLLVQALQRLAQAFAHQRVVIHHQNFHGYPLFSFFSF